MLRKVYLLGKKSLGKIGEDLAKDYLENTGYQILQRNWRYGRYGEIDLIAYSPHQYLLVFVEVKTRRNENFGVPQEAVTPTKQSRIRSLAEVYLATQTDRPPYTDVSFDVITVTPNLKKEQPPIIHHLKSAF